VRSRYEVQMARLIQVSGLPAPVEQYAFAREYGRQFKWDFAWPEKMVALEVDGGRFIGRGGSGAVMSRTAPLGYHGSVDDNRKRNLANLLGWTVLVYTPEMMASGEAIAELRLALSCNVKTTFSKLGTTLWEDQLRRHVTHVFESERLKRKVRTIRKKVRSRMAEARATALRRP
jgi:hypothetical protein